MLGNAACFCIDGPSGRSGAFTKLMSKWLDSEAPLASTLNPVIKVSLRSEQLSPTADDKRVSLLYSRLQVPQRGRVKGSVPRALVFSLWTLFLPVWVPSGCSG